ncbi:hypothetical protein ILYODFUR_002567 [Ilyodon furcidens]|uniref:Uncharacterized protein n=1 Tax=Ilyodon furcidens TaxID=33524 RepID=A0ABV0U244_9TELE
MQDGREGRKSPQLVCALKTHHSSVASPCVFCWRIEGFLITCQHILSQPSVLTCSRQADCKIPPPSRTE